METGTTLPVALPNPWHTIWLSPRRTIRQIVDAEVRPSWAPVIALTALHQALMSLRAGPDGTLSFGDAVMPIVMGVVQLVFGILVGPFLLAFVGGWLGGDADPVDIRQSVAWSNVPYAIAGLAWIPVLIAYRGLPSAAGTQNALQWLATPFAVAPFLGGLWTLVLQVITLAEVQRFSIVRALASMIILLIPALLLGSLA